MSDERLQTKPSKPTRLAGFASFFKGYMSVSTIVAAAIPIPVASWKLIPIYSQQRGFLTVYASLFCFLLLAFMFSIRHRLARPMFFHGPLSGVVAALPALFIVLTLVCIVTYHGLIQASINQIRELGFGKTSMKDLLDQLDATQIPYAVELAACYLGIFLFAELAFVLMAIREYLQDLLHLDEVDLLLDTARVPKPAIEPDAPPATRSTRISTGNPSA